MAEIENEQLTPELQRIKAETEAKPGFAEYKRNFDLQHGERRLTPDDLKPVPEAELTPLLLAQKRDYEARQIAGKPGSDSQADIQPTQQPEIQSTETADTAEGSYDPAWETSNEQCLVALEQEYGNAARDIVDNDLRTVFAGYIEKYPNDVRFVQELTMRMGNHPGVFRLLNHLATRLRYSRT